jgi:hypothetical protein
MESRLVRLANCKMQHVSGGKMNQLDGPQDNEFVFDTSPEGDSDRAYELSYLLTLALEESRGRAHLSVTQFRIVLENLGLIINTSRGNGTQGVQIPPKLRDANRLKVCHEL